jgi:hypothetical protein
MFSFMKAILPILAILLTAGLCLRTLTLLVLCVAGAANSNPQQLREIKLWAFGYGMLGLSGTFGGIAFLFAGRPGLAVITSLSPVLIQIGTAIYQLL